MTRRVVLIGMAVFTALAAAAADKKLAIQHMAVAQSEDGTPVPSDFRFAAGDVIFFSCQVAGYTKRPKEDDNQIDLSYQVEARDSKAVLIIPIENGKVAANLGAEDKDWLPKIRHSIALPPLADSGQYRISVKVKDNFGNSEAEASAPFAVESRDVAPSDTLVVRNFRFLRTEEDKDPLQIPAYRLGDTVWARFDMTGYKIGEKNHFDVEYGLKVLRPSGETTYEQPHAADEKNESFYPQRYTPGVLSLNLPRDLNRGGYTIVLTVRDNVGNQSYETRQKFAVE
jgi:hypothetical protein